MSILQAILASVLSNTAGNGGGGGGGGGGPAYLSWTIEWWEKKLSPQVYTTARVFSAGVDVSASIGYSNEQGGDYVWTNGSATGPFSVGSIANAWHHFSVNSDGTTLYVFMDGTLLTSAPRAGGLISDATTAFLLGGDTMSHWKGRITDFHILKGVCKYTTTYSPPGRITAAPETVFLLECADSTFTPSVGPAPASIPNVTFSTDDPWTDEGGSAQFSGQLSSYIEFSGNAVFALDVA